MRGCITKKTPIKKNPRFYAGLIAERESPERISLTENIQNFYGVDK
jgi:hypothetical protein